MTTTARGANATASNSTPRIIAASLIGTTIEWYDFFVYGSLAALIFNELFFSDADPVVGTILALSSFAVGFAARPVGGLIFGHFGDTVSRKKLLMISMVLMGVATVLIGLLPTYAQIGVAAPILLTLLRIAQGIALGGEWGGAVLIIAEQAPPGKRGFAASWPQMGAPLGSVLATGVLAIVTAVLPSNAFLEWGWRIPFLLSIVLLVVGYWIRSKVAEPKVFTDAIQTDHEEQAAVKVPLKEVVVKHPKALIQAIGGHVGINVLYYMMVTFSIVYITQEVGGDRPMALLAVSIASAIQCVLIIAAGAWSDRIGRKPPYLIGAFSMVVFGFAFFPMLGIGSFIATTGALTLGLAIHSLMYGPQASFYTELFPTRVRFTGISAGVQIASIFAGGLAPIIATALLATFGSWVPVAVYMAAAALVTAICVSWAPETFRRSLTEED